MSSEGSSVAPWSRADFVALAVLAVAMLALLPVVVHPWYDPAMDAALYVHTAKAIAAGEGYSYLGVPFIVRPPGWSLVLAPIVALRGVDFLWLNSATAVFGVLCVLATFVWTRPRVGTWPAFALAAALAANPFFVRASSMVLSDVPGVALLLVGLILVRRWRERPSLARAALAGVLIALAAWVRTLDVLLAPAAVLAALVGRRDGAPRPPWLQIGVVAGVPFVALVPWVLHVSSAEIPVPPEQVYLHSYGTAMWHVEESDPGSPRVPVEEILGRVPVQLRKLLPLIGARMRVVEPSATSWALAGLALACWLWLLVLRRGEAELFFGLALGVLAIYFAFRPRLGLPFFVLALPFVVEVLQGLVARAVGSGRARVVSVVLLAGLAVLDFEKASSRPVIAARHAAYREVARHLNSRFPPEVPLATADGVHWGLYLDAPVYSLSIVLQRKGMEESLALIDRHEVGVVFALGSGTVEDAYLRFFTQRLRLDSRVGDVHVFRVPKYLRGRVREREDP